MIILTEAKTIKRGCEYCTNVECKKRKVDGRQRKIYLCPFVECPYHELDNEVTYALYLASLLEDFDMEILLKEKEDSVE